MNHEQKLPENSLQGKNYHTNTHDDLSVSKANILPLFAATEASAVLVSTVANPVTVRQTAQTSRW